MHAIIKKLRIEGALVGHWDFRLGHLLDISGNGNHGVGTDIYWTNAGVRFPGTTSKITVADSAELQLTTGALVVFSSIPFTAKGTARIICKRDAGGTNYDFNYNTTTINIYDGSNERTRTANFTGKNLVGINMPTAGGTCEGFLDNISNGNYSSTSTFTANDAPLILGNYYNGSLQFDNNASAFLIFNRILTATEWSQLYGELSQ